MRALNCFLGTCVGFTGWGELCEWVLHLQSYRHIDWEGVALFGFGGWNSKKLAISRAFFCFCTKTAQVALLLISPYY